MSSSAATYKTRLVAFYGKHAPEKLEDGQALDDLLKKSAGKEEKLFEKLVAKYGPEPAPEAAKTVKPAKESKPAVAAAVSSKKAPKEEEETVATVVTKKKEEEEAEYGSRGWWKERLVRFYAKYAPEKTAGDMDLILDKAKDDPVQLDKLFRMLEKKYGPEPEPSSESSDEDEEEEDGDSDSQEEESFDAPKQKRKQPKSAAELREEEQGAGEVPDCLQSVLYCPVDGVPPEFSEYFPDTFKSALPWLAAHTPDLVLSSGKTALQTCTELGLAPAAESAPLAGKAQARSREKKKNAEGACVVLEMQNRRGKKAITSVSGLELCVEGLRLKDAAKLLGKKFASGASVKEAPGKGEVIEIQGDVIYDLPEVLMEFYPSLDKKRLFTVDEDGKKTLALS